MQSKMTIEYLPVKQLHEYSRNAKKHPAEQVELIANSLKEFGWRQPLVVDRDNVLVIGHGRLLAAKKLGMKTVPVVRANDLTAEQINALRLADNKTAESEWDVDLLAASLDEIADIDMSSFGFDGILDDGDDEELDERVDWREPSATHNVFENQEVMQFESDSFYGMPQMKPTQTVGDKLVRFSEWREHENPEELIAHFYYDDFKFISAWREPNKYIDRLRRYEAVISPDFSLYTDFPRALQILSCYRRQWCGAYWQMLGLDVIPDVVWGDEQSFDYCFDGIPKGGTVAVSTLGVRRDADWNNTTGSMFKAGYDEMMRRLEPSTVIVYGSMVDGLTGNIINVPAFYQQKFRGG